MRNARSIHRRGRRSSMPSSSEADGQVEGVALAWDFVAAVAIFRVSTASALVVCIPGQRVVLAEYTALAGNFQQEGVVQSISWGSACSFSDLSEFVICWSVFSVTASHTVSHRVLEFRVELMCLESDGRVRFCLGLQSRALSLSLALFLWGICSRSSLNLQR